MIEKRNRWSDPKIVLATLAVLNGGYWQYQAIGRADNAALTAAATALAKQVEENGSNIIRHEMRLNEHDRRLEAMERHR